MLQRNLSVEISISASANEGRASSSTGENWFNSSPVKIRFAAVTSSSVIKSKEAVQSE